jgi:hypothetical protein
MIRQVTVLDALDPHPQDVIDELIQICKGKIGEDGVILGSYQKFSEDYWDDYIALPKYLVEADICPDDEILIVIGW